MKKFGLIAFVLGLTGVIIPLLQPDSALAQARVQRLWVVESAERDPDNPVEALSECAGQYRLDRGPKAQMRGACKTEDPALLGATVLLRHINGETGVITDITTFRFNALRRIVSLNLRTPGANVPFATTNTDVLQVIGPDGFTVVMMGGWR